MKKTILSAALCLFLGVLPTYAQKESIVLHYNFKNTKGKVVTDMSPNHANAKLMGTAQVKKGNLSLDQEGAYLDMGEKAGKVMQGLKDFTVSMRYKVNPAVDIKGNGFFLWCFSTLEANKEKDGPYQAYRVNQQRCETSIGGWSQETGIQANKPTEKGKWISVIFRQKAGKGELFIDGKLIGTETGFPELSKIFKAAPKFNWIGRAPFAGDKYMTKTKIDDFRVYSICISDKTVKKLADKAKEKNLPKAEKEKNKKKPLPASPKGKG